MDARELIPARPSLPALRKAAAGCQACALYRDATQTVFGAGTRNASLVFVGEQPGDQEDRRGEPFVGPAGHVFDDALAEAGIDRREAYVTNAVKHFKWKPSRRGNRRLHQRPNAGEMRACRPWLDTELAVVKPQALVLLGATAAQSLLGASFRITQERGRFLDSDLAPRVLATYHPSAILRAEGSDRELLRQTLIDDLSLVAGVVA
jgi:DNA polymerase